MRKSITVIASVVLLAGCAGTSKQDKAAEEQAIADSKSALYRDCMSTYAEKYGSSDESAYLIIEGAKLECKPALESYRQYQIDRRKGYMLNSYKEKEADKAVKALEEQVQGEIVNVLLKARVEGT